MASWFYVQNNQQVGPVTLEQLQAVMQSGALHAKDRVWHEGMPDWVEACTVPELQAHQANNAVGEVAALTAGALVHAPLGYQSQGVGGVMASERAIDMLRQTGPWVRFMSVMCFISVGLMVVGGIAMFIMGFVVPATGNGPPFFILALVYIPMGVFYIFPAVFLGRYASGIKRVVRTRRPEDLEAALSAQKSFWKFVGIFTAIVVCLYLLFIAGMAVFGVIAASHRPL